MKRLKSDSAKLPSGGMSGLGDDSDGHGTGDISGFDGAGGAIGYGCLHAL